MKNLRKKIIRYFDFIEDKAFIDSNITVYKVEDIVKAVMKILAAKEEDNIIRTLLFCRDISVQGIFPDKTVKKFRQIIPGTPFFPLMEKLVYHPNYFIRSDAVYTLGKMSFQQKNEILEKAFSHYLECDPLICPRILFELFWLNDFSWELVKKLVMHKHFLFRWQVLEFLESYSFPVEDGTSDYQEMNSILEKLSKDAHPLVRTEAVFKMAEHDGVTPAIKPEHTVFSLSQAFLQKIYYHNNSRYHILELEEFIAEKTYDVNM